MNQTQYLYHYTTINALALILKNRTIRFTRLDHVNDIGESHKYGKYDLSPFLFVSCWTDDQEENIPLWYLYSKGGTGVRLSLPKDPFDYQPTNPQPVFGGNFLPIEEIDADEYILNINEVYFTQIKYVDENELAEIRNKAVQVTVGANNMGSMKIDSPIELAKYKSKKWKFEAEVRYVKRIFPSPPIPPGKDSISRWINSYSTFLHKAILNGTGPSKKFFDISVNQNAIDNIEVKLAPFATEEDNIIVNALLQKFTKNGSLSESNLPIRKPIK